jgi:hypothetical protein
MSLRLVRAAPCARAASARVLTPRSRISQRLPPRRLRQLRPSIRVRPGPRVVEGLNLLHHTLHHLRLGRPERHASLFARGHDTIAVGMPADAPQSIRRFAEVFQFSSGRPDAQGFTGGGQSRAIRAPIQNADRGAPGNGNRLLMRAVCRPELDHRRLARVVIAVVADAKKSPDGCHATQRSRSSPRIEIPPSLPPCGGTIVDLCH